jgi:anti-sigma B factor antagonist
MWKRARARTSIVCPPALSPKSARIGARGVSKPAHQSKRSKQTLKANAKNYRLSSITFYYMSEQINVELRGSVTTLRLQGQFIGGDETDLLREEFKKIMLQEKPLVAVDLQGVSYLNSTALGVFISAHANITKRGGRIALCSIGKNIENIFVITKLTLVFEMFPTLDDAINQFSS